MKTNTKDKILLTFIAIISIITIIFYIAATANAKKMEDVNWREVSYRIKKGDTLWDIAERFCPEDVDIRDYISMLKKENGIGSMIYAGDVIKVFVEV